MIEMRYYMTATHINGPVLLKLQRKCKPESINHKFTSCVTKI